MTLDLQTEIIILFELRHEKTNIFCICENKNADQMRSNCAADQHLCFRYTDSTIPLLSKPEGSSLCQSSVAVQPGLCRNWSETPKTGFLTTRLILFVRVCLASFENAFRFLLYHLSFKRLWELMCSFCFEMTTSLISRKAVI